MKLSYLVLETLVDLEYVVTEDDLKNLKLEKGLMTLIDEQRNSELSK